MFLRQKEHCGEVADLSDRVEDAKIGQVVDHRGMMMEAEIGYLGRDKQKDDENRGPDRYRPRGREQTMMVVRIVALSMDDLSGLDDTQQA